MTILPNVLRLVDGELKMADGSDAREYLRAFAERRNISPDEPMSLQTHEQAQRSVDYQTFCLTA